MIVVQRSADSSLHYSTYKQFKTISEIWHWFVKKICFCTNHSHSFPSTEVSQTELDCGRLWTDNVNYNTYINKNNVCSVWHISQSCKKSKDRGRNKSECVKVTDNRAELKSPKEITWRCKSPLMTWLENAEKLILH